jgi:hypothetical protein
MDTTLVSIAVTTADRLASNGGFHLLERFRFSLGPKAAGDFIETG